MTKKEKEEASLGIVAMVYQVMKYLCMRTCTLLWTIILNSLQMFFSIQPTHSVLDNSRNW